MTGRQGRASERPVAGSDTSFYNRSWQIDPDGLPLAVWVKFMGTQAWACFIYGLWLVSCCNTHSGQMQWWQYGEDVTEKDISGLKYCLSDPLNKGGWHLYRRPLWLPYETQAMGSGPDGKLGAHVTDYKRLIRGPSRRWWSLDLGVCVWTGWMECG